MDSKTIALLIALLISLGYNVYEISKDVPMHCNDTERYSGSEKENGGKDVDANWAKDHVNNYRNAHLTDETIYKTTGFTLSKKVFDNIFNNSIMNGVSLDLIEDESKLTLIVKGLNTENTAIDISNGTAIFINQSMCPADCSIY